MFTPAATAARTASEPEWWKVPSPRFWTRWLSSVNGAMPIHCAPSPPICVMPVISPLPSGFSSTIVWQPMPAPTSVPSGAFTELLCGQPEQKNGVRCAIGSSAGRPWISASLREARLHRVDPHAAGREARGERAARSGRRRGRARAAAAARRARRACRGCAARRPSRRAPPSGASRRTGPSPRPRGSRRGRGRTRARSPARAARSSRASGSGCRRARGRGRRGPSSRSACIRS